MGIGDIIAMLGLNLAFITAGFVIVIPLLQRDEKKTLAQFEAIWRRIEIGSYKSGRLAEIAILFDVVTKVQTSLITRLLVQTRTIESIPKFRDELGGIQTPLDRVLQELMLVSQSSTRKRSAVQQLGHVLGNEETLALVSELQKLLPDDQELLRLQGELRSRFGAQQGWRG